MSWVTELLMLLACGLPLSAFFLLLVYLLVVRNVEELVNVRFLSESLTWPTVSGRITASRIESGRETDAVVFKYRYTVDGRTYTGTRANFALRSVRLHDYPVGLPVVVYYRPSHPKTSVLEPGGHVSLLGAIWTVIAILLASILLGACLWSIVFPQ